MFRGRSSFPTPHAAPRSLFTILLRPSMWMPRRKNLCVFVHSNCSQRVIPSLSQNKVHATQTFLPTHGRPPHFQLLLGFNPPAPYSLRHRHAPPRCPTARGLYRRPRPRVPYTRPDVTPKPSPAKPPPSKSAPSWSTTSKGSGPPATPTASPPAASPSATLPWTQPNYAPSASPPNSSASAPQSGFNP
jgi:hypothetical protein